MEAKAVSENCFETVCCSSPVFSWPHMTTAIIKLSCPGDLQLHEVLGMTVYTRWKGA